MTRVTKVTLGYNSHEKNKNNGYNNREKKQQQH